MTIVIHDDPDLLTSRIRALSKLKDTTLKVGLPASAGGRLAFILAVQQHGSPILHIPSRPVIRPALNIDETRITMASHMRDAIAAAWEGKDFRGELEATGQAGADGIRAYIDSHIPPGNSPVTIGGGWIYNRAAKKAVYVAGKGFDKPLFDTGGLYDAFGFEIEEK